MMMALGTLVAERRLLDLRPNAQNDVDSRHAESISTPAEHESLSLRGTFRSRVGESVHDANQGHKKEREYYLLV
jgi:hypothetical protein